MWKYFIVIILFLYDAIFFCHSFSHFTLYLHRSLHFATESGVSTTGNNTFEYFVEKGAFSLFP